MRTILRQLHASLPGSIRYPLDVATASIQDTLQNWRLPAYRVQAAQPDTGNEATMLLLGNKPQYASWIHKLFGCAVNPVQMGKFSHYEILRGNHESLSADIALCPLNTLTLPIYSRLGWRIVPLYINCHIDLNKPIAEIMTSKGAKDDLRIAYRSGYQYTLMKDEQSIHDFFHQMLIPTIRERHEDRAFLSEWENIQRTFHKGFLIGAYLEKRWIGAVLLAVENASTIRIANIGWENGDATWLKKGIATALYNQSFIFAQEKNFKYVNLGSNNPFANDGPLNYKLKLGANITPIAGLEAAQLQSSSHFMGVKINLNAPAAQHFLSSTPLLEYKKNKLSVIGWNADIPPLFRRQVEAGIKWINLEKQA